MKITIWNSAFAWLLALFSCSDNSFSADEHHNSEIVEIYLNDLGIDHIPHEIEKLKNARELTIGFKKPKAKWIVYPPLSAMQHQTFEEPFMTLPISIGYLSGLQKLNLSGLGVGHLPIQLSRLKKLEYLDLSLNKLEIDDYLELLKSLESLEEIRVFGNNYSMEKLKLWKEENPEIYIDMLDS